MIPQWILILKQNHKYCTTLQKASKQAEESTKNRGVDYNDITPDQALSNTSNSAKPALNTVNNADGEINHNLTSSETNSDVQSSIEHKNKSTKNFSNTLASNFNNDFNDKYESLPIKQSLDDYIKSQDMLDSDKLSYLQLNNEKVQPALAVLDRTWSDKLNC